MAHNCKRVVTRGGAGGHDESHFNIECSTTSKTRNIKQAASRCGGLHHEGGTSLQRETFEFPTEICWSPNLWTLMKESARNAGLKAVDLWQWHPHIVPFVPRFSFTWSRAVIKNAGKKRKMIKGQPKQPSNRSNQEYE